MLSFIHPNTGSNFDISGITVDIGGVACNIDTNEADKIDDNGELLDEIVCTLASLSLPGGDVPVKLKTDKYGNSINNQYNDPVLQVAPSISSVTPSSGSELGGQTITIDGVGLRGPIQLEMNGAVATVVGNADGSETAILVTTTAGTGAVNFYIESSIMSAWFNTTGYVFTAPAGLTDVGGNTGALAVAGGTVVILSIPASTFGMLFDIVYPNGETVSASYENGGNTMTFPALSRTEL